MLDEWQESCEGGRGVRTVFQRLQVQVFVMAPDLVLIPFCGSSHHIMASPDHHLMVASDHHLMVASNHHLMVASDHHLMVASNHHFSLG